MRLNLILYCVLLFCLEFSASVPHESNSQKQSGIYDIRPLYPARNARIPRSHQAWNQRRPYQLPPQYQPIPQINRDSNLPNNIKKPVPNAQQQIPQASPRLLNRYSNQQRVPSSAPTFPNRVNQDDKIVNIPEAQKSPIQNIPGKLFPQSQIKQQSVGNPTALRENAPRIAEKHSLPHFSQPIPQAQHTNGYQNQQRVHQPIAQTQYEQQNVGNPSVLKTLNEAKLVNISPKYNLHQKVPERPSLVVKARESYVNKPAAGENNHGFKNFAPRIPSRPSQVNTPKTHLNQLHVKIIPSREIIEENKIPRVAPVRFEDRYLASASNPVETITKNFVPPNYNMKQFVSNSNIRNVLATTKHKRRYLVIHPNGTVEHVDKLETVSQRNPNYVLIRAGDIISNPIQKEKNVQKVVAKHVNNNKLNTSIVDLPNATNKQPPTAPNSGNISKLAKPVSTPPKKSTVHTSKDAQPTINAGNITVVSSTQKAPTNISSHNGTLPSTTPPKMKIIFSKPSSHIKNPNDDSHKASKPITKVDTYVSNPVNEEIRVLADVENPIARENNERNKPNNKPIIIYGTNVTHTSDKENQEPAKPAKSVKPTSMPVDAAKKAVVTAKTQSPSKVNDSPVVKAVVITETKPKVNSSTPVGNEVKVITVDENKTSVNAKPLEDKSAASSALTNASAKVNLTPAVKAEAIAKPFSSSTEGKTPESKQPSINLITQTEVSDKEDKKHNETPIDDKPKNSTAIPSKQEVKEEKNIPENTDAADDSSPVVWFRTSDPAFWEQLKEKDDIVYFFQIHNQPKVEYNTTRTIFPNGTVFEETSKYLWEIEGDSPIVTKTTKIIDPENSKS